MKKALILYWHGLGDIIQLTPHLRHLYNKGYITDLMCMEQTTKSKMLDNCLYTGRLISVPNTWKSSLGFKEQASETIKLFEKLKTDYSWSGMSNHMGIGNFNKIDFTSKELNLGIIDKTLEVFISEEEENYIFNYISSKYPDGYIFVHTFIDEHKYHNWDASGWIKENLPDLPIFDTHDKGVIDENINFAFVIAREAKHRVLCSSVFVHACDAMGCTIDVINYGRPDRKVWLLDQDRVLHVREKGEWIK